MLDEEVDSARSAILPQGDPCYNGPNLTPGNAVSRVPGSIGRSNGPSSGTSGKQRIRAWIDLEQRRSSHLPDQAPCGRILSLRDHVDRLAAGTSLYLCRAEGG